MSNDVLIKIKRGKEAQLPVLADGELGFCIDTQKLYIGTANGNKLLVASQTVGDMLKTIYDTNNDGKVDSAEKADSVPWSGVTGKPSTFTPSSHNHDERYYTESEIETKLSGKANTSHSHSANDITESATKRFVTDAEKSSWNAKASTAVATTSVNGLMSSADKTKLNGIAAGANNYTHPSSHPASMITGLASVATSGNYNDLSNKPTSIPANGGNADTVGGKYASDFLQAAQCVSGLDLDTITETGFYYGENVINSVPVISGSTFIVINHPPSYVIQIQIIIPGTTPTMYIRRCWNKQTNNWTSWKRFLIEGDLSYLPMQVAGSLNVATIRPGTKLFVGSSQSWTNRPTIDGWSNAFLSLNTLEGYFYSQLWFDTSGDEFYHRTIHNNVERPWRRVWHSGNLTNLSQLTNGPGYITASGNAASATKLQTARTINGVAFDGTRNITITAIPESHTHTRAQITDFPSLATVATSGSYNDLLNKPTIPTQTSQLTNNSGFITTSSNITGNAATATKLRTARTINGVAFDGTANITITATPNSHTHPASQVTGLASVATSGNYNDLSNKPSSLPANGGNATTATRLATPRKINGVSFDGTKDITIPSGGGQVVQGYYTGNGAASRQIYFSGINDPCLLFILGKSTSGDGSSGIYQAVFSPFKKQQALSADIYAVAPFESGGITMGTTVGYLNLDSITLNVAAALNKSGVYYEYIIIGS